MAADSPLRLLVVQNDADKTLGRLAGPLEGAGVAIDVRSSGAELPDVAGYDGLVILPGLADPVDDDAAVHRARAAAADALAVDLPVLGVCLGAQVVAQAAGGDAYRSATEVGYGPVRTTDAAAGDRLFRGTPATFSAFHAHRYAFTPPPGAVVLAESDACAQAVRLGDRVWAIQFHPEVPLAWADAIAATIADPPEDELAVRTARFFADNGVAAARLPQDARAADAEAARLATALVEGFVGCCRDVRDAHAARPAVGLEQRR